VEDSAVLTKLNCRDGLLKARSVRVGWKARTHLLSCTDEIKRRRVLTRNAGNREILPLRRATKFLLPIRGTWGYGEEGISIAP